MGSELECNLMKQNGMKKHAAKQFKIFNDLTGTFDIEVIFN